MKRSNRFRRNGWPKTKPLLDSLLTKLMSRRKRVPDSDSRVAARPHQSVSALEIVAIPAGPKVFDGVIPCRVQGIFFRTGGIPMDALGMVETKGLIGAIEAADAMVKTAKVTCRARSTSAPATSLSPCEVMLAP